MGKRVARRSRSGRRFLVVLAVAAVSTGIFGWSAATLLTEFGDDLPEAPLASPSADGDPTETATPQDDPSPDSGETDEAAAQVARCAEEIDKAVAVVEAARPGVDSWSTHVQARTDMLAGRITEKRMTDIYATTMEQGHEDVRRFEEAAAAGGAAVPCEELRSAGDEAAADCLARSEAAAQAVAMSEDTIRDWSEHLHHMEQYDDGGMSTGTALRLWIKAWRSAPENIGAFEEASTSLEQAPSCSAA